MVQCTVQPYIHSTDSRVESVYCAPWLLVDGHTPLRNFHLDLPSALDSAAGNSVAQKRKSSFWVLQRGSLPDQRLINHNNITFRNNVPNDSICLLSCYCRKYSTYARCVFSVFIIIGVSQSKSSSITGSRNSVAATACKKTGTCTVPNRSASTA